MAFNPFETFRKRSKVIFALLGIVVMLTFVLSSGGMGSGDFFTQLQNGLTGGRSNSTLMAKAFDEKVYDADLAEIRKQRQAANFFMQAGLSLSYNNWAIEIDSLLQGNKVESATKGVLERFVQQRKDAVKSQAASQAYGRYLQGESARRDQDNILQQLAKAKEGSPDQAALSGAIAIMRHDVEGRQGELYFMTVLNRTDREALDFWMLLKKSEKLGLTLSPEGIKDLIKFETNGKLKFEDERSLKVELRTRFPNMEDKWLVNAIGNEFRVRAAVSSLRGNMGRRAPGASSTASGMPQNLTPYQFFEFYKDMCSEHSFTLLALNAESVLDRVTGTPTAAERLDLFKKYGKQEPEPARETPGFKEPRKIRPEFVAVDAKNPKLAAAKPILKTASIAANFLAGPLSPGSGIAVLTQASYPALAETLPPKEKYDSVVLQQTLPFQEGETYFFRPRDNNVYHPAAIASFIGASVGGNPTAAVASYRRTVEMFHHRDVIAFNLQGLPVGFAPHIANAVGSGSFALATLPKTLPEAFYAKGIADDLAKESTRRLFEADIEQLQKKLRELTEDANKPKGDKTKAEAGKVAARKHVDEWLASRGLKSSATKGPVDRFSILTDPELKPLNDKASDNKSDFAVMQPDAKKSLASFFFEMRTDMFDPRMLQNLTQQQLNQIMPLLMPTSVYEPRWFPSLAFADDFDKPHFLVWSTEEIAPQAYNTLEQGDKLTNGELTKRIDAAWKLEKARELLKAEAEKIGAEVKPIAMEISKNPTGVEKQLRDLAEKRKLKMLSVENLAKLKFDHSPTRADQMGYAPPTIKNDEIKYPTPDMADKLLEVRNKPLGEVLVLPENGKTTYYVAVSTGREEKTAEKFRDNVFTKTSQSAGTRDPLYFGYAVMNTFRLQNGEMLKRLHLEAKLEETDDLKKSDKKDVNSEES
jgi:hypothetical protein